MCAASAGALNDINLFDLNCFVKNITCKLSTITDFHAKRQILCVVSEWNDILFHFTNDENFDIVKIVRWFRKTSKTIIDICFDPNGIWLLVICSDNTIHVVPALSIVDQRYLDASGCFSSKFITSYTVPQISYSEFSAQRKSLSYQDSSINSQITFPKSLSERHNSDPTCSKMPDETLQANAFPVAATWWKTLGNSHRAIIGYSDGSIIIVELITNCPLLFVSSVGSSPVVKLSIYRDNGLQNVFLLITSLNKQYKLLLEQKSIDYIFPGDNTDLPHEGKFDNMRKEMPQDCDDNFIRIGLLPTAKARLSSLKMLGTKKISAMKLRQKQNSTECDDDPIVKNLTNIKSPDQNPELLSDENGPIFATQNLQNVNLLSALHTQSSTLSVYRMDTTVLPLFRYKVPKTCNEILITSNILYSKQFSCLSDSTISETDLPDDENNKNKESGNLFETSIAILSSALASIKTSSDDFDNQNALLSVFHFYNEIVINVHRKTKFFLPNFSVNGEKDIKTQPSKELNKYEYYFQNIASTEEVEDLSNESFPKINFDPCYVVTNKNIYFIDLRKEPLQFMIDFASENSWKQCEQFCNIFDLSFSQSLEYVGDYFLRKKKVNQALLSYNVVKIPPVRIAWKLAMHQENYPLMHLCALALKNIYVIKSKFVNRTVAHLLFPCLPNLHAEDVTKILPRRSESKKYILDGEICSNFKYNGEESPNPLQMTLSSQFHLSNLLLITLAEKAVRDKNYISLWNYLVLNGKYHTNMTSIVLAQSGLHSSALLLAKTRGSLMEVFVALTSVLNQEFGFYSELNVCLYNLTDPIFTECLIYLKHYAIEYMNIIQNKITLLKISALERLEKQLNPFAPIFRPLYFNHSAENNEDISDIIKILIETYLIVVLQMKKQSVESNKISNGFNNFNLTYEENKLLIAPVMFTPLAVGCSHCACVIDGVAYFWGSNGIPIVCNVDNASEANEPAYAVKKFETFVKMFIEVYAVKCGRQHSLILTNNGLFSVGSNHLGQLGVDRNLLAAQHPLLIETLDSKNIRLLEAGQYHNAVVADNKLYTWGWGIHGQLGHGDVENISVPKKVEFFIDKHIISISLGHAHSLVLCAENSSTQLYVFGSNHFGQLGLGQITAVKLSTPHLLELNQNIKIIHTKFFCNLALTENNELLTWGSSPQALRLANQSKKRISTRQKISESIKREIIRREGKDSSLLKPKIEGTSAIKMNRINQKTVATELQRNNEIIGDKEVNLLDNIDTEKLNDKKNINMKSLEETEPAGITISITEHTIPTMEGNTSGNNETLDDNKSENVTDEKPIYPIAEPVDHTCPQKVDTDEVIGFITHLSSGLFHFALVTSESLLYTWGRNYEHQLGNEDKERKQVLNPKVVESIAGAQYVECGADCTLILTKQNIVQAFGGNANGQCGQGIKSSVENNFNQNRLLCLPTTKRLMRHETHCVMYPNEIELPSPKDDIPKTSQQYFKSIPKFKRDFLHKIDLSRIFDYVKPLESKFDPITPLDEILSFSNILSPSSDESDKLSSESSYSNSEENSLVFPTENLLADYIHYCLFIFHGLYNAEKLINIFLNDNDLTEFKVRIFMLNYNYLDAFSICLLDCNTAQKSIKVFEFFTKDTSILPIKKDNIKFFISRLLNHFVEKNFEMTELEKFFLSDLNYYVTDLSFVIYFNNDSAKWSEVLNQRLESFLNIDTETYLFDKIDEIFDKLSVSFKTVVSKRIIKLLQG